MGCTSSLLIHRGWRLAGLFRLWCPGNEKKRLLRTRILTSSAPRPGRIVPSTNQKASIVWWVAQVHCLYIEDEDWLVCFDCDALEMKKKDSFAPEFLQVLHHALDVLFRVRTKCLYCLMGCTGSLFIHRGWRLAGLFRLWRPGNEKKLLRTRIFTSSAPRPGRIVPSTNQKASVVWWVAHVHCLYIEDEDWLVCFDCDALEMKKTRLLRTRILTSSAPRPGRIVPSTNQKASIDRWVAQVHCLYIEDEDWQVCFDCDALERKKKDSFAPEFLQVLHHALDVLFRVRTKCLYCLMGCTGSLFIHRGWRLAGLFRLWRPGNEKEDSFAPEFLQVLHHARDVLFRVRTKKPLLFDGLHRFIVYT